MKFQRSTFLIVLLATLLTAGWFVVEVTQAPESEQLDAFGQADGDLFDFEEEDIVAFEVQRPDVTLAFRRRPEPEADQTDWVMEQPVQEPASDGAVAYLLNFLAIADIEEEVDVGGDRRAEFGFDRPTGIVTLTLVNGSEHVFVLGNPNFNSSGLYALIDTPPDAEALSIKLVTPDFEPAINRPVDEWKASAEAPPEAGPDANSPLDSESEAADSTAEPAADPAVEPAEPASDPIDPVAVPPES